MCGDSREGEDSVKRDSRDREHDRVLRDQDRERDRVTRDEENERQAETERRGEQLKEAWRQRHPEKEPEKGRPKKGGPA
jgi:hypothetical protein